MDIVLNATVNSAIALDSDQQQLTIVIAGQAILVNIPTSDLVAWAPGSSPTVTISPAA